MRNHKYYGIPYFYCAQMLFYRKDIFENNKYQKIFYDKYKKVLVPPKTWQEFNIIAEFFTKKYNPESETEFGTTLGGKNSSGAMCEFFTRLWAYGGKVAEGEEIKISSREALKALNNYYTSFKYANPKSVDYWWDEQVEEFSKGKAAMMMTFGSHATKLMDNKESKIIGKIGFTEVPGGQPMLGGWSLAINGNSLNKELAWKFLRWTFNTNLMQYFTILGACIPSTNNRKNSALQSLYPWYYEHLMMYKKCKSRVLPILKNGEILSGYQLEKIVGNAIHNTIIGKITAADALKNADQELNKMMD